MSTTQQITEYIRLAWTAEGFRRTSNRTKTERQVIEQTEAEFDAWLRQIKAEAWQEAADEIAQQGTIQIPDNPYQEKGEDAEGRA